MRKVGTFVASVALGAAVICNGPVFAAGSRGSHSSSALSGSGGSMHAVAPAGMQSSPNSVSEGRSASGNHGLTFGNGKDCLPPNLCNN